MAHSSPHNPVDYLWKPNMTDEEKRNYRKLKHRWHAARSRRLRGRDVPEGCGIPGKRISYDNIDHSSTPGEHYLPFVGDYDGDGYCDGE